jgi:hypothetical protein
MAGQAALLILKAESLTVNVLGVSEPVTDLAGRVRYTLDQGFEASALRGSDFGGSG